MKIKEILQLEGNEQKEGKEGDDESRTEPLKVFVQVNTSGESQKSGVAPGEDTIALAKHIVENVSFFPKFS
ncbi:MAG: hypothetical protein HOI39_05550 [Flavobacteriales bacterium]|nr:hypothetical protein [Flavobacteriales bacterium]